jgi:hypothetical protein
MKKGDKVKLVLNGKDYFGVLSKGGKRPTMVLIGGDKQITVPASKLVKDDFKLPEDPPNCMSDWTLKNYKEYEQMSEETDAFTAVICYKGKPVITVKNDGRGGCNDYQPVSFKSAKDPVTSVRAFINAAEEWAKLFINDAYDPADYWLVWQAHHALYGCTAKKYFDDYTERRSTQLESVGL